MAGQQVKAKWRPPLSWIVIVVLLGVLALPIAIVFWFYAASYPEARMGPVEMAAIGLAAILTLFVAVVLSRTITGPINALVRTTEAIGRGGVAPVAPQEQHGTREIAVLSQSFLDLAARLVERTTYVHTFAAHVGHELKSPLTAIRGYAELLLDETIPAADRQRFARNIIADSDRLAALLDRLRMLARTDVPLDAKGVSLRDVATLLAPQFPNLAMPLEGEVDVPMALSEEAAVIVLSHLADNAAENGARTLTLAARSEGGRLHLRLCDDGTGISPGNRDRIFEPFFTTRREAGGTGMGLGIAKAMLEAHGGSITLVDSPGGTAFEIVISASN